jgi:DNA-binding CsgD family transcriptional regulator
MSSPIGDRPALLGEGALASLCMRVLEHMSIGVLACNEELVVLAATPTARRLLSDFGRGAGAVIGSRLPPPVREAAGAYMRQAEDPAGRRRVRPHRIETADASQVLYVAAKSIEGLLPATVAIRLHQERLVDVELFEALSEKFDLSARDRRLIAMLRQRHTNGEIAGTLNLTVGTVKVYMHELFEKLDVRSRSELVAVVDQVRKGR